MILPVITVMPALRVFPHSASMLASQTSGSSGCPITSEPRPLPTSTPLMTITPGAAAKSRRRQSLTAGPNTAPALDMFVHIPAMAAASLPGPCGSLSEIPHLEGHGKTLDIIGNARARVRRLRCWHLGPKSHRHFALDGQSHVICAAKRGRRVLNGGGENPSYLRATDAPQTPHFVAGIGNLVLA